VKHPKLKIEIDCRGPEFTEHTHYALYLLLQDISYRFRELSHRGPPGEHSIGDRIFNVDGGDIGRWRLIVPKKP
jgi:hypothetical protein